MRDPSVANQEVIQVGEPQEVKYRLIKNLLEFRRGESWSLCICPFSDADAGCGLWCPLFKYDTYSSVENKVFLYCGTRRGIELFYQGWEVLMFKVTNHQFAKENKVFKKACKEVGIPPTRRQASKWRRNMGLAYKKGRQTMPDELTPWEETLDDPQRKKSNFYHSPVPRKRQTHTAYRGRSRKPKVYTKVEILIFQLNQLRSIFE